MRALCRSVFLVLAATQPTNAQIDEAKIAIVEGTTLLHQGSRQSPLPADGTWSPKLADVQRLEALLPYILTENRGPEFDTERVLSQSVRQYAGFIRNGKQYLYANFLPANAPPDWRTKALVICDGGAMIFGVEMDVDRGKISHISFNGP